MKLHVYKYIVNELRELIANTKFEGKTYCVGGCCRDKLLGNEIKDIDIVVELPNGGIELAEYLYSQNKLHGNIITYPKYGTAMFKLKHYPKIEIEVVHTRSEKYPDRNSRNPVQDYGTIKEDCMRRDLTINALYYNISEDKLVDVCGHSIEDIKNKVINTPCDPNLTYQDDPLRILRCVRFATRYDWSIKPHVYQALKDNIYRLEIVSDERITSEFDKIISDKNFVKGLLMLEDIDALKYILSPFGYVKNKFHYPQFYDVQYHIMTSPLLKHKYTRLAMLLYPYPQYAELILSNRKYSRDDINRIVNIIKLTNKFLPEFKNGIDKSKIRHLQYECKTKEMFEDICNVFYILWPCLTNIANYLDNTTNHYEYVLPINGQDIIDYLHIEPSKKVREILSQLLVMSFNNPDLTKEECFEILNKFKF